MRRPGGYLLSLFLLPAAVLLVTAGLLLGTETGTATVLRLVQSIAPGVIEVERTRGHLLDRLVFDELRVDWGSGNVQARQLVLDWSPRSLARLAFVVNELSVTGLRYNGVPAAEQPLAEPLQWPIELPEFTTPLPVIVKKLTISDMVITLTPESTPILIDTAGLVGRWDNKGITVERFESTGPGYTIVITGRLDPMDAYQLDLDNQLQLQLADGVAFELEGTIQGNTGRLDFEQRLSGDADIFLSGSLDQVLVDPHWNASLNLTSLPATLFNPDLPLQLSGKLESRGSWSSAVLTGQLETASATPEFDRLLALVDLAASPDRGILKIKQFDISQHGRPLRLSLAGELATDMAFDFAGEWHELQWPLDNSAIVESSHGQLSMQGVPSNFQLEASVELSGKNIPAGQWQLSASGNQQRLDIASLTAQVLGGSLEGSGVLGWEPIPSWQFQATARQINPASVVSGAEGLIDFSLSTDGSMGDAGLQTRFNLLQLGGELNSQALTGSGKFAFADKHASIDSLAIQLGDAVLQVDGAVGPQSDLQWLVEIPALEKFQAYAVGNVSSAGRLTGPQRQPHIVGTLKAGALGYQDYGIGALDVELDVDLQDQQRSSLVAGGSNITHGGNKLERVDLAFDGFIRQHSLTLSATPDDTVIEISARGAYEEAVWNGTLEQLELAARSLGPWHLRRPVALSLGSKHARSDTLCMVRENASLCADGEWQADGESIAAFELVALPLDWFKAWLPEQLKGIGGELSATGDIKQGVELIAALKANITPGELILHADSEDIRVAHSGAELDFSSQGEGVTGTLVAGIDSSRLKASIHLPDLLQVSDPMLAGIDGSLQFNAPDLTVVPLLAPMLTRVNGSVNANFELGGQLGRPQLDGEGKLLVSRLELADIGLQLTDTRMDVGVVNDKLTLAGSTVSGGSITVDGELELDADKDWPLRVSVTGEDFVAANLPNIQLLLSPDLQLERQSGILNLTGTLTVPSADIRIRDLPADARSASPDVVVLRRDAELQQTGDTTPIATDIVLVLGNEVHLSALGFSGFVAGEVNLRATAREALLATGDVRIDQGTYRVFGQRLEIERGLFSYTNSPLDNPGVNVKATRAIGEVIVGVNALGTARKITVTTFSSPSMSENDRISYLLTGKPANQGATVSLERQVARNLSVGVNVDTKSGESAFVTRYRILRTLHTEVGSSARSSTFDLFYTIERE